MKLKSEVKIFGGWKSERIFFDAVESLWMTATPLFCGIMFGVGHNIWYLALGVLPLIFKFIYKRNIDGKNIIYLR
jgi:hypothetical protein